MIWIHIPIHNRKLNGDVGEADRMTDSMILEEKWPNSHVWQGIEKLINRSEMFSFAKKLNIHPRRRLDYYFLDDLIGVFLDGIYSIPKLGLLYCWMFKLLLQFVYGIRGKKNVDGERKRKASI